MTDRTSPASTAAEEQPLVLSFYLIQNDNKSSRCGTTRSAASQERWDEGFIPGPAQWVMDLELLWLRWRLQLQLGSDPWPRNSVCREGRNNKTSSEVCRISEGPKTTDCFSVPEVGAGATIVTTACSLSSSSGHQERCNVSIQ